MVLYFFGADKPWHELSSIGFNRRNTNLLKSFVENDQVEKVYVIHRTIKTKFFKKVLSTNNTKKVKDIFFASLFPETRVTKILNNWIIRIQLLLQTFHFNDKEDLLFCYLIKGFQDLKVSGIKGRIIFDTDHNLIENLYLSSEQRISTGIFLVNIASKVDWYISSSRSMIEWLNHRGIFNTYRIRNAVDWKRFENIKVNKSHDKIPIIGYCGTLSKWIDWDFLCQLLIMRPQWCFTFIGSPYNNDGYKKLLSFPNVKLLGKKSSYSIPHILNSFDICLVLYKNMQGLDVDSMKIFEYLAAGVPVISTRYHHYLKEDFNDLLNLADSPEDVIKKVEKILTYREESTSIKYFLSKHTWNQRVEEIIKLVE